MLRRILSRRVSVEAMIEAGIWFVALYVVIGLVWAFFDAEQVQQLDEPLRTRLPAGSDMAAFLMIAALWPWLLLGAHICVAA
jgi:hypothetical protein